MKKLICFMLCLMLPVCALAAPVRDMQESVLSESELATMRAWLDSAVREALPVEYDENTYVGAYVYACVEDGGCYVLECDVYLEDGGDTMPRYAPDDALTWLCDATVCVQRAADGWTLVSCETGEYYLSQRTVPVQGTGYMLSIPDIYTADTSGAYDWSYSDELGQFVSGIRYRCEEADGASLAEYAGFLAGESEDILIAIDEDLGTLVAQDSGMYLIVIAGEGVFYSLTLTYPEDREAEFTLYGEFLRNSFVIDGEANG